MTITTFLIFALAVSLIVAYVTIIHHSLSGPAANDPNFDANAPAATGIRSPARETTSHLPLGHAPHHA